MAIALAASLLSSPATDAPTVAPTIERTFAGDVEFLKGHRPTIVLSDKSGKAKVAVVPSICGRIFTSTAGGDAGRSYGFLDDDVIAAGKPQPKITAYGGEDRFWLGPEGGQFAIFFKKGDKFTLDDWQTPAAIDTDAYTVVKQDDRSIALTHQASLANFTGTKFDVKIDRTIRLIDASDAATALHADFGKAACVAFESENSITNTGKDAWTEQTGELSLWILGMFKPSPTAVVVVPFITGPADKLGPIVNDNYFGKVPAERLKVSDKAIFFKADGQMRTKIGLSPSRTKPVCGSYDKARSLLTIVTFTKPDGATKYVNSMWEQQKDPFAGDVLNSYNHGMPAGMEPAKYHGFYEIETSSPAAALKPGEKLTHTHRTIHLEGDRDTLDTVAKAVFGVGLAEIESALK